MSNILVTGATGFVGHSLIKILNGTGHHIHATFRNSIPYINDKDDIVLPLFSGHSYGYVWTTQNDVVPTGSITLSIMTSIMYGGAGS